MPNTKQGCLGSLPVKMARGKCYAAQSSWLAHLHLHAYLSRIPTELMRKMPRVPFELGRRVLHLVLDMPTKLVHRVLCLAPHMLAYIASICSSWTRPYACPATELPNSTRTP